MNNSAEALLIYPPVYDFALYDLFLKPFGLLRLGTLLEAGGWNINLINALDYTDAETVRCLGAVKRFADGTGKVHRCPVSSPSSLRSVNRRFARYGIPAEIMRQKISEKRPDAVFISTGMTYWYKGVMETIRAVRDIWPDVPVVTGGVYASLMPEHCNSVCGPDYNLAGNAASRGGGLLNSWLSSCGLPAISGFNGETPVMPLDVCFWKEAAVLRLNEGCPLSCEYCASNRISGFKEGDPVPVFNWLKMMNETRGIVNFAFYDDALLFKSDSVFIPFLHMVIDYLETTGRSINFYTPNAMHIRYMTAETASLMKKAGFREVRLGFESSSPDFHSEYDNKYSERGFHNTVKMLSDAGFGRNEVIVYILAGLPEQRAEEVEETIRFAAGEGLQLSISEFSPVPGSPMWDRCVSSCRFPLAEEPLYHNNSFFPMEWEGFTREDMQRLKMMSKNRVLK